VNCLWSGNQAEGRGGAIFAGFSAAAMVNCSFSANVAGQAGGAVASAGRGGADATNCIFWNNLPQALVDAGGAASSVRYSDVQGGWAGPGNIDADPLFADFIGPDGVIGSEDDDLRLGAGSPGADAGDSGGLPADAADQDGDGDVAEPIPLDLDGAARRADDPAAPDRGAGAPPMVDMGAYERIAAPACPADVTGDGAVDAEDLVAVILDWGGRASDVTGDGTVSVADLVAVVLNWGDCPGG
jgi:hypothetical protein